MKHSIKEIIDNQESFKENIISYLLKEFKKTKKSLNDIETDDKTILRNKEKLKKKLSKTKYKKSVEQLFFMHSKRNKIFYVWWDDENKEATILKYGR